MELIPWDDLQKHIVDILFLKDCILYTNLQFYQIVFAALINSRFVILYLNTVSVKTSEVSTIKHLTQYALHRFTLLAILCTTIYMAV